MYANRSPCKRVSRRWPAVAVIVVSALLAPVAPAMAQHASSTARVVIIAVDADSPADSAAWTDAFLGAFDRMHGVTARSREQRDAELQERYRTTRPRRPGAVMQQGVPFPGARYWAAVDVRGRADSIHVRGQSVDLETTRIFARLDTVVARTVRPAPVADVLARRTARALEGDRPQVPEDSP